MKPTIDQIRQSFIDLRKEGRLRHREIANQLEISEGELIAAHLGLVKDSVNSLRAIRLSKEWPKIIDSIEPMGDVMALTRNKACVHEKIGRYQNARHNGAMGLLLGEIDLRIFYQQWHSGFAITETTEQSEQRSLQFFDTQGNAVHKIHLKPQSDVTVFDRIVSTFSSKHQEPGFEILPVKARKESIPDHEIDLFKFQEAWRNLRDTHDFFHLLEKYSLERTQALRLAGAEFAMQVSPRSAKAALVNAAQSQTPIMIFVGNSGAIQIHTGHITNVIEQGSWINVMDPRFNLHLQQDFIDQAWIVRKPTIDGIVTSIEFFDKAGDAITMFFGERKPGIPELQGWRDIVTKIEREQGYVGAHS